MKSIRSEHKREFKNQDMDEFCHREGIHHHYSAVIILKRNGVVERKNRTLQKITHVMIHAKKVPNLHWDEAISFDCYILNHITVKKGTNKTSYELWIDGTFISQSKYAKNLVKKLG